MELPKQLQVEGINFVRILKGTKKPFEQDWTKKPYTYQQIQQYLDKENYGIMGGGEKRLIIVDFDNQELQDKLLPKFPETFTVKTGTGKLHLYYFSDRAESFKIFDEEMNTLMDVQGEGKQAIGPGSIHPNGNSYSVIKELPIATINYAELKALIIPHDKKPKKEFAPLDKNYAPGIQDDFLSDVKRVINMPSLLSSLGVDTHRNPTSCLFHSSKGGKCLGFNNETAHCFHCDGSWNIFSLVKEYKKCDFKEALEYLANLGGLTRELEESRKRYIEKLKEQQRDDKEDTRSEYLELIKQKKWSEASEVIVDWILRNNKIYTTKDDIKTEMWIYQDGIYVAQGKSEVKEQMRSLLGHWFSAFTYNQVINKLEPDTFIDANTFFNQNHLHEIPVLNGILDLRTRRLHEFTSDKIFFNKLPVIYNPLADCPQVDKFLADILASEDDRLVFYELGGFCLWKEYKFEKAFMFVGNGRNGKDKSLELIKRLIGIENCCSVPLSSLIPDSFIISEFFGKMVNIAGEITNQDLKDTSEFKSLTGRSLKSAQRKFLKPVTFVNYAKFIFACNDLPMVYDNSKGFWDRWVLLEFPYTFVPKEELEANKNNPNYKLRDEGIIDKITTANELSGLLNRFLDGLDRLMDNKRFSSTKGSEEIKNIWIRRSNSFMAFCMDFIENEYDACIGKKDLRKRYVDYCKKHKISVKSDFVAKKTLQELYGVEEERKESFKGDWERYWSGIKWKGSYEQ